MAWVKLDDGYYEHRKIVNLGPLAELLWVRGIAYANRYLTDGFIAYTAAARLSLDLLGIRQELDGGQQPGMLSVADRLVEFGLWTNVDEGYQIHDYGEWQRTADAIRLLGEKRAVAGRKGAASRWQDGKPDGNSDGNPEANDWQTDSRPIAEPEPEPDVIDPPSVLQRAPSPNGEGDGGITHAALLEACLNLEIRQRANTDNPVDDPTKWKTAMRKRRWAKWGTETVRLHSLFPDAPADVIAAAVVNDEKHSLRHYGGTA